MWVADQATQALRRQVSRRAHIVRQRTRLKNQVQSILHRNLIPRCPAADVFGIKGRCWLANQPLPADEEFAIEALLRQLDFHGQELRSLTPRWAGSRWLADTARLASVDEVGEIPICLLTIGSDRRQLTNTANRQTTGFAR